MKEDEKELNEARKKYTEVVDRISNKIAKVCDFNGGITYCQGDGHLVINIDTDEVADMKCLQGKTVKNKLTVEQHREHSL